MDVRIGWQTRFRDRRCDRSVSGSLAYGLHPAFGMPTACHATARFLVDQASRVGAERAALAELGVSGTDLARPGRLPIDRMYHAWTALIRETGDPAIGVRATRHWTLDDLGLFGFCVATAPTLRDGLDTAIAYMALVTDSGTWRSERSRDELRLVWSRCGPPGDGLSVSNEVTVSGFVRCLRGLFPRVAVRVTWRHPRWRSRPAQAELLGCDVEYGAGDDAIGLSMRGLDAAAASANVALWRYLCALADREIANLAAPSLVERARHAIAEALDRHGGRPDVASVARALGTSERSLRRHLAAEGTTIRALLAEICLERGAALLAQRRSITDVALDSGFSDASAFSRAWRRRHGASPSRGRNQKAS